MSSPSRILRRLLPEELGHHPRLPLNPPTLRLFLLRRHLVAEHARAALPGEEMGEPMVHHLPARLGLVPRVDVVHGPDNLHRGSDEADLAAQVFNALVKLAYLRSVGDVLAEMVKERDDPRQRQPVALEIVVVDDASASAARAALEVRLVEALEDAPEQGLGGAAALRGGFLGVFEEDAELEAGTEVLERVEIPGAWAGV